MDTTIRNLDEKSYRRLKARAALSGTTVGEIINQALAAYLDRLEAFPKTGSLNDIGSETYGKGTERLSEEIDAVVYRGSAR